MKHDAVQLAIISERISEDDILAILNAEGAKGYTTFEAGGNSPLHLHPSEQTALMDAFHLVKIEVILLDPAVADHIATRLMEEVFQERPGVVSVSQVQVFRPQKF